MQLSAQLVKLALKSRHIPRFRRDVGMVFQDHKLLADRPVYDNVALPLIVADTPLKEIDKKVRAALDQVGLLGKERVLPLVVAVEASELIQGKRAKKASTFAPCLRACDESLEELTHATRLITAAGLRASASWSVLSGDGGFAVNRTSMSTTCARS